jgi:hypothetical protein
MARTGRPPQAGAARKRQFAVRVTPEEEREILEMAAKAGLSVSEWLRAAVLAAKMISRNPESVALVFHSDEDSEVLRIVSPELAERGRRSKGRRRPGGTAPA